MVSYLNHLPNGKQQFFNANGVPLALGTVTMYVPNTTDFKDTWSDAEGMSLNDNPLTLDAGGMATIYGSGDYRQIVKDALGNTIWDEIVSASDFNSDAIDEANPWITVAANSTVDLGAVASQKVKISGNTTINSFGTAPVGLTRQLWFTGGPSITNSAAIVIPNFDEATPIDLRIRAGDTMWVVSSGGGVWKVMYYQSVGAWSIVDLDGGSNRFFALTDGVNLGQLSDSNFFPPFGVFPAARKIYTGGLIMGDPGDTTEVGMVIVDGTPDAPVGWVGPYPGGYVYGWPRNADGTWNTDAYDNDYQSFIYVGRNAQDMFPINSTPTLTNREGSRVFNVCPVNHVTPFQRAWISPNGCFIAAGRVTYEDRSPPLAYPYDPAPFNRYNVDAPSNLANWYETVGKATVEILASSLNDLAAFTIRNGQDDTHGLEFVYNTGDDQVVVRNVVSDVSTNALIFDLVEERATWQEFVKNTAQPCFLTALTTSINNATGDGTAATVVFDTEIFDQSSAISGATFTAQVTGRYQLQSSIQLEQVGAAHTRFLITIQTSNRNFERDMGDLTPDANGRVSLNLTTLVDMDENDTAVILVTVSGSTKTINILGSPAPTVGTNYSGYLVA